MKETNPIRPSPEALKGYAESPIVIKKLPKFKLTIAVAAKLDSIKGDKVVTKHVDYYKFLFDEFKEKEIKAFLILTAPCRETETVKTDSVENVQNSASTKAEKRLRKKAEKINSEKAEAKAFVKTAEGICKKRINQGAAMVNSCISLYSKFVGINTKYIEPINEIEIIDAEEV